MLDFKTTPNFGTYYRGQQISNAVIEIIGGYRETGEERPSLLRVRVSAGMLQEQEVVLEIKDFNIRFLKRSFPEVYFSNRHCQELMDGYLNHSLMEFLTDVQGGMAVNIGTCFRQNGIQPAGDGSLCAVEGAFVLGCKETEVYVVPEVAKFSVFEVDSLMGRLPYLLLEQPAAVLLTLAFTLLCFIRSFILDAEVDFQALLYICGSFGKGKTQLAKRVAGIVAASDDPRGRPALCYSMTASTAAAVSRAMSAYRDLPIIIDDFCKSAGKDTERKGRELCAKVVRDETNSAPAVKLPGQKQEVVECVSGVIVTAEMELENPSDLERCIFAPVHEQLDLPAGISTEAMRGAAKDFILYFLKHQSEMKDSLKDSVYGEVDLDILRTCKKRPRTNLLVLRWVFHTFILVAEEQGADVYVCEQLCKKFDNAIEESAAAMKMYLEKILCKQKEGNLAYILLKGYQEGAFDLLKDTDKKKKLSRHDGIVLSGDLCLRSISLRTFVRRQNGYHDWSMCKIVNELLDYGALRIQEEGTFQVKISKGRGIPRVYRIVVKALEENAKRKN